MNTFHSVTYTVTMLDFASSLVGESFNKDHCAAFRGWMVRLARRVGSTSASIRTIRPSWTVNDISEIRVSPMAVITPGLPLMTTGRRVAFGCAKCIARFATFLAPETATVFSVRVVPPSAWRTRSGSSTVSNASRLPCGVKEGVHDTAVLNADAGRLEWWLGLNASSGSTCELARRGRTTFDNAGDLVERDCKKVMRNEGEALGWIERLEDDEKGDAH
jgi:hypothetical protein